MQSLMSLIDKNARLIPEGDYLQMCRIMKELHRSEKTLLVTPDVVGEDFIMTSDALNRCHKWIMVTNTLHDAFVEHEKDPEDKVKAGNLCTTSRSYSSLIGGNSPKRTGTKNSCGLCIEGHLHRGVIDT
jgi:hypothetical protein